MLRDRETVFHAISAVECINKPYISHNITPKLRDKKYINEISLDSLILYILIIWGIAANVVKIPAIKPIISGFIKVLYLIITINIDAL